MKKQCFILFATLAIAFSAIEATTVIPPTFEQLVQQAELIFQGTVTDVRSVWEGEGAQRHIDSYITFQVQDSVKGSPGSTYTMKMLGGTVGDETMEINDSPKFNVGDRDILFVEHNYEQFVPLVGINYGRFHVGRDAQTGRDIIANGEGEPIRDLTKLGHEEEVISVKDAISPEDFKSAIKTQLNASSTRPAQ